MHQFSTTDAAIPRSPLPSHRFIHKRLCEQLVPDSITNVGACRGWCTAFMKEMDNRLLVASLDPLNSTTPPQF
ncbi:hypothetical protein K443DRAFT_673207 [Laccaria amethystina LaAM-08-1]|uniref:Uncharacterized protein n=1 Tax=Laccaria amethystina LaAM-08-1 TaxID=1095629 RepID=A0A0C9X622_9AGAR|nr:hypothetical protein K443DRAFT_673207 [Laccaria amethystina LaAM-08-1]